MATTKAPSKTKVVTGKVRLSYVHVFEPYASDGDDESKAKYSTVILIPKTDTATLNKIEVARAAAIEAGKHSKFDGKVPPNLVNTLHDGDEEADLDKNPEYAGHMYMSISSNSKPGVVDQNVQPILDSTEVYSGCYARVSMNAAAYNYKGKKGISFYLSHVQKLADGESFTGRTRAEDDFDAVEVDEDDLI